MAALSRQIDRLADLVNLPTGVLIVVLAALAALGVGTLVRLGATSRLPRDKGRALRLRLRSWWILFLVLAAAVIIGPAAVIALFLAASLLALREFNTIARAGAGAPVRPAPPQWAWIFAPAQYALIYLGLGAAALAFIPVGAVLALTVIATLAPRSAAGVPRAGGATPDTGAALAPRGFLRAAGAATWSAMLLIYFVSHAPMLLTAPPAPGLDLAGGLGLLVYLMILTETNDISQALWGRRFGRRKVVPRISPGKTWEGLLGGGLTTVVLAIALAPLLTPWAPAPPDPDATGVAPAGLLVWWLWPAVVGLILCPAGFLGDIAMSALKREAGVKDSGDLLPGQGGMLDRIDSLTFTAPVFYYLMLAALPAVETVS